MDTKGRWGQSNHDYGVIISHLDLRRCRISNIIMMLSPCDNDSLATRPVRVQAQEVLRESSMQDAGVYKFAGMFQV